MYIPRLVLSLSQAFQTFDEILSDKEPPTTKKFLDTMNRSLVDSNMFVRALILSLEHFLKHREELAPDYTVAESRLLSYIADFDTQIHFLFSLVKLINVQNLTQENVSCLNTTLVFLMFANQKAELPKYLLALSKARGDVGLGLLRNFRDLLVFWQEHYLHKDKDCSALERSSRIPFDYWKKTVATLVSVDRTSPDALGHYLPTCELVEKASGSCVKPQVERDS